MEHVTQLQFYADDDPPFAARCCVFIGRFVQVLFPPEWHDKGADIQLVIVFVSRHRSASRGNALLLVGAPDSGKTAVLSTVRDINM